MKSSENLRIEKEWLNFSEAIMPKGASVTQRQEMRKSFYAGVATMLEIAKDLGDEDVSEDSGVETLESIEQECKEFFKSFRQS